MWKLFDPRSTAAAVAYGLDESADGIIAVYDMGGGTFDVSIMELAAGVFRVLATHGDTFLGGEDFDMRIIEKLAQDFEAETQIDLRKDKMALQRLKEAAERAKHELSTQVETEISLPFITSDDSGPRHLEASMTRSDLEDLIADLVERSLDPCAVALDEAGLTVDDVDDVVLVGGMTRMPLIQQRVMEFFRREPHTGLNPDEVVAAGASIQGAVMRGELTDVLLLDVLPLSLGVETMGGIMTRLIDKNTTIPCTHTEIFSTAVDNQPLVSIHVLQGEREMADDNHSLARFDVLSQLDRVDGHEMPVGQLSASLLTPNNNITRLLDRMERDGLLTRALNESDRRSFRVCATAEGLRTFRAMADENRDWIARAFEGLGAERMRALSGALRDVEPDLH